MKWWVSLGTLVACAMWLGCTPNDLDRPAGTVVGNPSCSGDDCAIPCTEGAIECHGNRLTVCRDGVAEGRECAHGCGVDRCNDCDPGTRRCLDDATVELCSEGIPVVEACDAGSCIDGKCVCEPGAGRCLGGGLREQCDQSGDWVEALCPPNRPICRGGTCLQCVPGEARCLDTTTAQSCSEAGTSDAFTCASGCEPASGRCIETCEPGVLRCRDRFVVQQCHASGQYYATAETCDVEAGESCDQGVCRGVCETAELALSPSGCRFFAPPLLTWHSNEGNDIVGSSVLYLINPDPLYPADVDVFQGGVPLTSASVPFGGSTAVSVPTENAPASASRRLPGGALRVDSSRPIFVVHHFNPSIKREDAQSGDTAFLLPKHLLDTYGKRHRVLTQPHINNHAGPQPGGFTLVSTTDAQTSVTLTLRGHTAAGDATLPAYLAGQAPVLTLAGHEAIHILSDSPGKQCTQGGCVPAAGDDLTGTLVESDLPIAVFNNGLSRIPYEPSYHTQTQLLEQLMPVALWDKEHVAIARQIPLPGGGFAGHEQWVVLTDTANNTLSFAPTPPDGVASRVLAVEGDSLTFNTATGTHANYRAFHLTSTEPVLVARYYNSFKGSAAIVTPEGGSTFALERPVRFWRSEYFLRPSGAMDNRLLLVVPDGVTVSYDGTPVGGLTSALSGYQVVEVATDRGIHRLEGSDPFGVLVYGYEVRFGKVQETSCYSYSGPVGFRDAVAP